MPAIREQRGTAAALTATNPVVPDGVIVVETDTGGVKIGDGATAWNSLPYAGVRRGSRGDITVSADGATWTINAGAVVTADLADGAVTLAKTTGIQKAITSGTAAPTGGSNGDIYLQYT